MDLVHLDPRAPVALTWTLLPADLPAIRRRCPRCDGPRPHRCARAFRVNGHHARLDVWLLYLCDGCGRTWKLPVVERQPVQTLDPERLDAWTRNDPDLIELTANDAALLSRAGLRPEPVALRRRGPALPSDAAALLTLRVPWPGRERLDRWLAQELGWSRAALARAVSEGGAQALDDPKAWRRPPKDGQRLLLARAALGDGTL